MSQGRSCLRGGVSPRPSSSDDPFGITSIAFFYQYIFKLIERAVIAKLSGAWCWLVHSQQAVRVEVTKLNKIASNGGFEPRVFNDAVNRDVLCCETGIPNAAIAWNIIMDPHAPNHARVLKLFSLIADQVGVAIPTLHRAVNAVQHSFKRTKLIIIIVADVDHPNTEFGLHVLDHLKVLVKNLRTYPTRQMSKHPAGSAPA